MPSDPSCSLGGAEVLDTGGTRWTGRKNSPEYRTILRWIQGARLESETPGGN